MFKVNLGPGLTLELKFKRLIGYGARNKHRSILSRLDIHCHFYTILISFKRKSYINISVRKIVKCKLKQWEIFFTKEKLMTENIISKILREISWLSFWYVKQKQSDLPQNFRNDLFNHQLFFNSNLLESVVVGNSHSLIETSDTFPIFLNLNDSKRFEDIFSEFCTQQYISGYLKLGILDRII